MAESTMEEYDLSAEIKGFFWGNRNPTILIFKWLYNDENIILIIILHFHQYSLLIPVNPMDNRL